MTIMILSENTYIRIGEIPKDKHSTIYYNGLPVGKEDGLAVYDCARDKDLHDWRIVLSKPVNGATVLILADLLEAVYAGEAKVYIIVGKRIGTSTDGTPLIDPLAIIEDVTDQFRELPDLAQMRANEVEPRSGKTYMDLAVAKVDKKEDEHATEEEQRHPEGD